VPTSKPAWWLVQPPSESNPHKLAWVSALQEDPAALPIHQANLNGVKLEADMNNEAGTQPMNGHATATGHGDEEVVDSEATVSISHSTRQPDDQPAVDQKLPPGKSAWHVAAASPTTSAVGGGGVVAPPPPYLPTLELSITGGLGTAGSPQVCMLYQQAARYLESIVTSCGVCSQCQPVG
jgi:hypothetical protein